MQTSQIAQGQLAATVQAFQMLRIIISLNADSTCNAALGSRQEQLFLEVLVPGMGSSRASWWKAILPVVLLFFVEL